MDQDQRQRAQLTKQSLELADAVSLVHDFASLVRQRQATQHDPWLARAATSALQPFRRFAKGLRADYATVQAGVTLSWRQGPMEGHINCLKMLKRRIFGRAALIFSPDGSCWRRNPPMAAHHASMSWQGIPSEENRDETRCSHAFTVETGFANPLVRLLCSVDRKHPAPPQLRQEPELRGFQSCGAASPHSLVVRG
jgi:hypothetical protein